MDRRFAFFSIVVLAAAGCKQSPYVSSHLEILGAERRALEDRVLDLEFELDRAEKQLDSYREDGAPNSSSGNSRSTSRTGETDNPGMTSPSITVPGLGDDLLLEPPRVNEGTPDGELPSPRGDSALRSPRYQQPTRPIAVRSRTPRDPRITHIALNPTLTGGTDFDRKSGDDGLIIVLEPRNSENEFVPLAGPVTAVVLDYAKRDEGAAALVARWDLDAPTVHESIVDDEYARGIQLRLPWPDEMPEHSKLRLDVRYTTADGRHLDARADVYITLPGQFSTRWTPRAPRAENGEDGARGPVNIAKQPDDNESAQQRPSTSVIQSAFTTVARAAEIVSDGTSGVSIAEETPAERVTIPSTATSPEQAPRRPTWRPTR